MLEIVSHKYLKRFVKSNNLKWKHVYSFGRIISKCLQSKDNYLINSEIFITQEWYSPLLLSIFLHEKNSIFILSREKIQELVKTQLPLLKDFGFSFKLIKDEIIFPRHKISFMTLDKLLILYGNLKLFNQRIILSESEKIKNNLKQFLRISLFRKDWLSASYVLEIRGNRILDIYNSLKQKFFSRAIPGKNYIHLDVDEIQFLEKFFEENSELSTKFNLVKKALSSDWACWINLDYDNFEWILNLEPINELSEVIELFTRNQFIFLSSTRKDHFLEKYFKDSNIKINLLINFKSNYVEKNILIYVPSRQILPNNPVFTDLIFEKCKKLIILRYGLNVILTNENRLKIDLATKLASEYGQNVLLEKLPKNDENIICSDFSWWINNLNQIAYPQQIIVPLLPIPSISEPINAMTVSYIKRNSRNWFRDFLLLEALQLLDSSVAPLRRQTGKLFILDGRINNKQWGRDLLQMIQPSKVINYKFPFE